MPLVGPAAGLHIPRKRAVAHPASPSMLKCLQAYGEESPITELFIQQAKDMRQSMERRW